MRHTPAIRTSPRMLLERVDLVYTLLARELNDFEPLVDREQLGITFCLCFFSNAITVNAAR